MYGATALRSEWRGYALGILSVAVALGLQWALHPLMGEHLPYITFFAAIAITAMYGSLGGSILAVSLSLAATVFLFVPSIQSFQTEGLQFEVGMAAYAFSAALIVLSGELLRQARQRTAEELAARLHAEAALRANEEQFRASFELAAIGKAQADPRTGRFWRVNPKLCEMTGYSPDELLQKSFREVAHPEDREADARRFQQLNAGETPFYESETRCLRKDGSILWVHIMASVQRDARGEPLRLLAVIQDVTGRREAEQALALSRQRYRALVSALTSVVWRVNAEGEFIDIQLPWEAFTGQTWEKHQGFGWMEALHSEDRERVKETWRRARESRSLFVTDGRLWHAPTEDYHYFEARAVPIFDPGGAVSEWIGCVTDVHERKLAELGLATAKEEVLKYADDLEQRVAERTKALQDALAELEAFSYSISHDMRAPLRAMHQFSQILLEDYSAQLDSAGQDYLQRIRNSAQRLDKLIEDVLTYSRVGRIKSPPQRVDLEKLLREIMAESPSLQPSSAWVEIQSPLLPVLGHETSLTQCLSNLLANAVKFVSKGVIPRVVVRTEARDGQVRLWVEDNGIGIASHNQDRIFKVFERIHSSKEFEGTGIGLAIVRKAVERMGGQIGLESQIGKGSKFWIQLPKG